MRQLSILAVVAALAACNQGPSVTAKNASVGEVAAKVATATGGASFVSPGRWESKVHFDKFEMPGMPPGIADKMALGAASDSSFTTCLTPEAAKKPDSGFFGGDAAKGCSYDHFTLSGGKIDAALTCSRDGHRHTMTMTGSYSPDSYQMAVTSVGGGPGPAGQMRMAMSISAKRTGACTGTEENDTQE